MVYYYGYTCENNHIITQLSETKQRLKVMNESVLGLSYAYA